MSDEKTIEALVAGKRLEPDQWYGVRATAYVRRTAAGRLETKPVAVQVAKVDSPDQPMPPEGEGEGEGGGGETLPEGGDEGRPGADRPVVTPHKK
jgi:hypothetical protein